MTSPFKNKLVNFLAHLYLSGDSEETITGNFIGDFVKGNDLNDYPDGIRKGIVLHRAIDDFTDHHEATDRSKELLRDKYHHYAGVIVDMFYDHFLAIHWDKFHPDPLSVYAQETYQILSSRLSEMPLPARRVLPYMIQGDWLTKYGTLEGLDQSLTGISRRTTFVSHMEHATRDLKENFKEFEIHFMDFFPDMIAFVQQENPFFRKKNE